MKNDPLTRGGRRLKQTLRRIKHVAGRLRRQDNYQSEMSPARWVRQYARGQHDYFLDGKTAELGRYGVILSYLLHFGAAGRIVDYGCGKGILGGMLDILPGRDYLGIDFLEEVVAEASRRVVNGRVICADINDEQQFVDCAAVIYNESLYYFENYEALFTNAFSQVRPGGLVIVSMFHTPVTEKIFKRLKTLRTPTECLSVQSILGRELHTWHVSLWINRT